MHKQTNIIAVLLIHKYNCGAGSGSSSPHVSYHVRMWQYYWLTLTSFQWFTLLPSIHTVRSHVLVDFFCKVRAMQRIQSQIIQSQKKTQAQTSLLGVVHSLRVSVPLAAKQNAAEEEDAQQAEQEEEKDNQENSPSWWHMWTSCWIWEENRVRKMHAKFYILLANIKHNLLRDIGSHRKRTES